MEMAKNFDGSCNNVFLRLFIGMTVEQVRGYLTGALKLIQLKIMQKQHAM